MDQENFKSKKEAQQNCKPRNKREIHATDRVDVVAILFLAWSPSASSDDCNASAPQVWPP